jgi:hypothetical protein
MPSSLVSMAIAPKLGSESSCNRRKHAQRMLSWLAHSEGRLPLPTYVSHSAPPTSPPPIQRIPASDACFLAHLDSNTPHPKTSLLCRCRNHQEMCREGIPIAESFSACASIAARRICEAEGSGGFRTGFAPYKHKSKGTST